MTLHLRPAPVIAFLLTSVLALALAGGWAGIERNLMPSPGWLAEQLSLFDLASENNVPTWFSAALLLASSVLALLLGAGSTRHRARWWFLALTLVGISLAEDASLLERSIDVFSRVKGFGLPIGTWRWAAVGVAFVLAAGFTPLIATLSVRGGLLAISAALLFCVGHWAFAWLGGSLAWQYGPHVASVVGARVAEETSKMLGEALGFAALLQELQARGGAHLQLH